MTAIKGRAATEQDALSRIYQQAVREGGMPVDIRLQRTPAMDVEYAALIVAQCDGRFQFSRGEQWICQLQLGHDGPHSWPDPGDTVT